MQTETVYDVEYFLNFFRAIPDELWHTGDFDGPNGSHCARGHCGESDSDDAYQTGKVLHLQKVLGISCAELARLNDGQYGKYQQPTPKARILAALEDIQRAKDAALRPAAYAEKTQPPVYIEDLIKEKELAHP